MLSNLINEQNRSHLQSVRLIEDTGAIAEWRARRRRSTRRVKRVMEYLFDHGQEGLLVERLLDRPVRTEQDRGRHLSHWRVCSPPSSQ